MRKELSLIIVLGIFLIINAQAQNTDRVRITLTPPVGDAEHVRLDVNEEATELFDLGKDAALRYSPYYFSTYFTEWEEEENEEGEMELVMKLLKLVGDARAYENNYFIDYPVYFESSVTGTFKISLVISYMNKSVFIRLIDKENPDQFIVLNEGPYYFTQSSSKKIIYDERFIVRIYAASLFKEDSDNNNWFDLSNWIGIKNIPGIASENDDRHSYCIVIPENKTVDIPSGNIKVGTLLNSGELNISKGATLTIENGAKMTSTRTFY